MMDEMKTSEKRTAENNQKDEVSNETTLDPNEVPVDSISNPEETSSTGTTNVTFLLNEYDQGFIRDGKIFRLFSLIFPDFVPKLFPAYIHIAEINFHNR